jgi:uncharacterized membrane protein YsdA (DUF1294 family)
MPKQSVPSGGHRRYRYYYPATIGGLLATAVLIATLAFTTEWSFYLIWLISLSATTFALFGIDKGLAAGQKRMPEIVLHLFTLLGGFTGQLFGRLVFRHKVSRQKRILFDAAFVVGLLLHGGFIYLLYFRA